MKASVTHLSEIPTSDPLDRHAVALAEFRKMRDDLIATHDTNDQLRADLHREQDRIAMLIEDRDYWREKATTNGRQLVELATAVANIGLLTRAAEHIILTVNELTAKEESGRTADRLDEAYAKGNTATVA